MKLLHKVIACRAIVAVFVIATSTAQAVSAATLTLEASAKADVSNDEMVVVMAFERDGADLASINQTVNQALAAAIADAKKVTGIKARLGSINTNPNWTPQGKPSGWRVRGEVVLTSKELAALGTLSGQLGQKLQISSIQFRLSDDSRKDAEKRLIRDAAQAFKDKATDAAKALGFSGYAIKDIGLNQGFQVSVRPMAMMRAKSDMVSMSGNAPVPTESGESEVNVTFNGSVELK